MKHSRTMPLVIVLGMLPHLLAQVQQPQVTTQNFYGFLIFHRALSREIATRTVASQASAERLETIAIAHYGISREEFAKITATAEPIFDHLKAIDQEALAYKATVGANDKASSFL